jgi:hypothetical protein
LERPATDKHSNALQTFVIYGRKKFYNIVALPATKKGIFGIVQVDFWVLTLFISIVGLIDLFNPSLSHGELCAQ